MSELHYDAVVFYFTILNCTAELTLVLLQIGRLVEDVNHLLYSNSIHP